MNVDGQILLWIQNNVRSETLTPIVLWLTNSIPYAAGLFVVLLFFRKTRKFAIFALSGLAVCLVCNAYVVKPLFARPRPFASVAGLQRIGPMPGGSSFPSSHTTAVFALAWMSVWCRKRYWIAPLFVYACLVAATRLYLGVHYPTDILGGIVVAGVLSYLTYKCLSWISNKYIYCL